MVRAGSVAFSTAQDMFGDAGNWVIVCGAGNNGGDGYVIARLALEAGKSVTLFALKSPDQLQGDAHTAALDWLKAEGAVHPWPPEAGQSAPDLLVDALLGTGLGRPVEGKYRDAIEWMNAQQCNRLAVDIPSGLNADTGTVMGLAVRADATVSFIGFKRGLLTCDGPDFAGKVIFDSLEVPHGTYDAVNNSGLNIHEKLVLEYLKPRARNSHKGHFGHVLVVGGQAGMAGAVRLAGEAALRTGSGLVSIATDAAHAATLNLARPELMVHAIADWKDLQPLLDRASALACGPGLGSSKWSRQALDACLHSPLPLVVDADGLNLLSDKPLQRDHWVLTPHPAEAGRLLHSGTQAVQDDRVESALELAGQYQAIVVLKGCGTVVAHPDGRYAICPLGNPGMATAGSGDVLSGVIASLLGQGFDPWQSAQLGVVIHAAAGDSAAEKWGERSMLAGDITDAIAGVIRAGDKPG
jgi:NAD(P)H-hydrate epimerase